MIDIDIIRKEEDWAKLADKWNLLLSQSITDVPFLRHEFLYAWWQHRGGGEWESDELYILTGRSPAGELVGALPLFLSKNHAGKPSLVLLGSIEIADNLDILATPEYLETFVVSALTHLTGEDAPDWETLELYNLLEDSPSLAALEKATKKHGLNFIQERLQPSPYIPLPESFDAYLESLDGRYRREMVRKMRNALRYFLPVEVVRTGEDDDLAAEMRDFFSMMREEPEKDRFLTDAMEAQMQAVAQAAAEHNWLDLRFLIVGRDKAAGYLNFVYDDKVWVYNSALAEKFASLSPGIALVGMLIEEAIQNKYTEFDLLRGDEEYKYHLGGEDRWVVKAIVSR